MAGTEAVLIDLARAKAALQLRAIVTVMGLPVIARCAECGRDPAHPVARSCVAANCPLPHHATTHKSDRMRNNG